MWATSFCASKLDVTKFWLVNDVMQELILATNVFIAWTPSRCVSSRKLECCSDVTQHLKIAGQKWRQPLFCIKSVKV